MRTTKILSPQATYQYIYTYMYGSNVKQKNVRLVILVLSTFSSPNYAYTGHKIFKQRKLKVSAQKKGTYLSKEYLIFSRLFI